MKKSEETIIRNKKGEFNNWKDLFSYVKTLTNKDFFMCGTGVGNVYVVIIKNGKLEQISEKFRWWRGSSNLDELKKVLDFINTSD